MSDPNDKIFKAFKLLREVALERMTKKLDDYPGQLHGVMFSLNAYVEKDMAEYRQVMRDVPPVSIMETRAKVGKKTPADRNAYLDNFPHEEVIRKIIKKVGVDP